MTLIKIDPKSIKKNPNAGNRDYFEDMGSTSTLHINVVDQNITNYLESKFNARLSSSSYDTKSGKRESLYHLVNADFNLIIDYLKKMGVDPKTIHINTQYHHQHFTSMTPEPDYFYEYEDTEVECLECKANFKRSELIDDSDWDYDGEDEYPTGSVRTCPKCGEFDCCELEFEKFVKP